MEGGKTLMGFDLSNARLCIDCNWVDAYMVCPKCTSKVTFPITRFLSEALFMMDKGEEMNDHTGKKED